MDKQLKLLAIIKTLKMLERNIWQVVVMTLGRYSKHNAIHLFTAIILCNIYMNKHCPVVLYLNILKTQGKNLLQCHFCHYKMQ
jgi:hypothetical protein